MKLARKEQYQLIIVVGLFGTVLSSVLGFALIKDYKVEFQNQRNKLVEVQTTAQHRTQLKGFLAANREQFDILDQAVPNQESILFFVSQLEALMQEYRVNGSFSFGATKPVSTGGDLTIPFTIRMHTPVGNATQFLNRFEKSPYITKINSLTLRTPQGASGSAEITVGAQLYVQNPF